MVPLIIGVGSWRQRGRAPFPWIFIHGTDIVDRALIALFFGLLLLFLVFFPLASPWKRLYSAIFAVFFAIFRFFFHCPPSTRSFSADALASNSLKSQTKNISETAHVRVSFSDHKFSPLYKITRENYLCIGYYTLQVTVLSALA